MKSPVCTGMRSRPLKAGRRFHVVEHLTNPINILAKLSHLLSDSGSLVVEVPSANDALLTLYDSDAFQKFTYWSQHLYLFTPETLRRVGEMAGLVVTKVEQYQRYPLSNHLYWLSKNAPGGASGLVVHRQPPASAGICRFTCGNGKMRHTDCTYAVGGIAG
jgi:hypothetical protein